MVDLFGEERALPSSALRAPEPVVALTLFDHAAERTAIETGRPVSQERTKIVAPASER